MSEEQAEKQEQWVPLTEAARQLGVLHSKLSKLAKRGTIRTKKDPIDTRLTLVDMVELRRLFHR